MCITRCSYGANAANNALSVYPSKKGSRCKSQRRLVKTIKWQHERHDIRSNHDLLPAPLGHWLVDGRFLPVDAGFAAIAWAFYPGPEQERHAAQLAEISRVNKERMGQIASFTFFFHFPVIMLFVGAASTLLDYPLKQQPTPLRYIEFACLVGASVGVAAIIMRGGRRPRGSNRRETACQA